MSYSVADFGRMLADEVRMNAHAKALETVVEPGAVVVDIGAGTGILALMAARLGARKVYAIEIDDTVEVARASAAANGYADRIECIQGDSRSVELPERADVVFSDLRGVLPLLPSNIPTQIDARTRFLAPGGILIPLRDRLQVGLASAPAIIRRTLEPFRSHHRGFDLGSHLGYAVNAFAYPRHDDEITLRGEGKTWAVLEYRTITDASVSGQVSFEVAESGEVDGLALWFEAELVAGVGFSTAPGQDTTVYRNTLLPWPETVRLEVGDEVEVDLSARYIAGDYVWRWTSALRRNGSVWRHFRQSTFLAAPTIPARLSRQTPEHRTTLSDDGMFVLAALEMMAAGKSNEEIAEALVELLPEHRRSSAVAAELVARLAVKYGR